MDIDVRDLVIGGGALAFAGTYAYRATIKAVEARRRHQDEIIQAAIARISDPVIERHAKVMEAANTLLQGLVKIGEAQVVAINGCRETVAEFKAALVPGVGDVAEDSHVHLYDEEEVAARYDSTIDAQKKSREVSL